MHLVVVDMYDRGGPVLRLRGRVTRNAGTTAVGKCDSKGPLDVGGHADYMPNHRYLQAP